MQSNNGTSIDYSGALQDFANKQQPTPSLGLNLFACKDPLSPQQRQVLEHFKVVNTFLSGYQLPTLRMDLDSQAKEIDLANFKLQVGTLFHYLFLFHFKKDSNKYDNSSALTSTQIKKQIETQLTGIRAIAENSWKLLEWDHQETSSCWSKSVTTRNAAALALGNHAYNKAMNKKFYQFLPGTIYDNHPSIWIGRAAVASVFSSGSISLAVYLSFAVGLAALASPFGLIAMIAIASAVAVAIGKKSLNIFDGSVARMASENHKPEIGSTIVFPDALGLDDLSCAIATATSPTLISIEEEEKTNMNTASYVPT